MFSFCQNSPIDGAACLSKDSLFFFNIAPALDLLCYPQKALSGHLTSMPTWAQIIIWAPLELHSLDSPLWKFMGKWFYGGEVMKFNSCVFVLKLKVVLLTGSLEVYQV